MTIDDPWEDEGFAAEDDWGEESLASDLEEEPIELVEREDAEAGNGDAGEGSAGSAFDSLRWSLRGCIMAAPVLRGTKGGIMPLYLAEFGYTPEVWAGLVKSPENREEAVRQMLESAGCTLHNLWYAFGEADGFAVIEAPDNQTAAGLSIAITASGAFRKFETHVLMTQAELLGALEKASDVAYAAPGAAVHA